MSFSIYSLLSLPQTNKVFPTYSLILCKGSNCRLLHFYGYGGSIFGARRWMQHSGRGLPFGSNIICWICSPFVDCAIHQRSACKSNRFTDRHDLWFGIFRNAVCCVGSLCVNHVVICKLRSLNIK